MTRCLLFVVVFFVSSMGVAQRTNPFDIGSADAQVELDQIEIGSINQVEKTSNNPFDIAIGKSRIANAVTTSLLPSIKNRNQQINGPTKGLVLVYAIIALIFLSIGIAINHKRFGTIIGSLINGSNLKTLHRNPRAWTETQNLLLYALFFANGTFVLWLLNARLFGGALPSLLYLFLGLGLVYFVRHLALWVMTSIYDLGISSYQFSYSIALHNMVIGAILIPFILAMGYMTDSNVRMTSIFLLIIIVMIYVLRQGKGLLSALSVRGFNVFYFFIYLCAFEITPFLIAWKVIKGAL